MVEEVEKLICGAIPGAEVKVVDLTGNREHLHLGVEVKSGRFKDKPLIERHRMVMDVLKGKLQAREIHAVQIKTLVP